VNEELAKLKEEIERAGLGALGPRPRLVPPDRLRALRIKLRIFLDRHRRALPRAEAAGLRTWIEQVDRAVADISARQRA
jgi:hypothetical protein